MTLVALSVPSPAMSSAQAASLTDRFREAVGREGLSLVFFVADGGWVKRKKPSSYMDTLCVRTLLVRSSLGRVHLSSTILAASSEVGGQRLFLPSLLVTLFGLHKRSSADPWGLERLGEALKVGSSVRCFLVIFSPFGRTDNTPQRQIYIYFHI